MIRGKRDLKTVAAQLDSLVIQLNDQLNKSLSGLTKAHNKLLVISMVLHAIQLAAIVALALR